MPKAALEGLRVVEIGRYVAAPYCARILSDLGADVAKFEGPESDPTRQWGPFRGDVPDPSQAGVFAALNAGKRTVPADFDNPADLEMLHVLLEDTDVLIEGVEGSEPRPMGSVVRRAARAPPASRCRVAVSVRSIRTVVEPPRLRSDGVRGRLVAARTRRTRPNSAEPSLRPVRSPGRLARRRGGTRGAARATCIRTWSGHRHRDRTGHWVLRRRHAPCRGQDGCTVEAPWPAATRHRVPHRLLRVCRRVRMHRLTNAETVEDLPGAHGGADLVRHGTRPRCPVSGWGGCDPC